MATGQTRFFPGTASSGSAPRMTFNATVQQPGECRTTRPWSAATLATCRLGGSENTEALVLSIFGQPFAGKFRVLGRDVQIGNAMVLVGVPMTSVPIAWVCGAECSTYLHALN